MECHTLNMVNGTRIFSPFDIDAFMSVIGTARSMAAFRFFLATGLRYREGNFVLQNPDMFDPDARVIHFKANKDWDRERRYKDRDIYLSYADVDFIHLFLSVGRPMNTKQEEITKYMKFWAGKLNMNPVGVGTMALRKTRFVWLLTTFPEYEDVIIASLNHNANLPKCSADDDLAMYKTVPFSEQEKKRIAAYLHGWDVAVDQS